MYNKIQGNTGDGLHPNCRLRNNRRVGSWAVIFFTIKAGYDSKHKYCYCYQIAPRYVLHHTTSPRRGGKRNLRPRCYREQTATVLVFPRDFRPTSLYRIRCNLSRKISPRGSRQTSQFPILQKTPPKVTELWRRFQFYSVLFMLQLSNVNFSQGS